VPLAPQTTQSSFKPIPVFFKAIRGVLAVRMPSSFLMPSKILRGRRSFVLTVTIGGGNPELKGFGAAYRQYALTNFD
jgi:hypothetical protein